MNSNTREYHRAYFQAHKAELRIKARERYRRKAIAKVTSKLLPLGYKAAAQRAAQEVAEIRARVIEESAAACALITFRDWRRGRCM